MQNKSSPDFTVTHTSRTPVRDYKQAIPTETIERLKSISPDELAAHGFISYAPNYSDKLPRYICPFCGSGSHDNQTSAFSAVFSDGIYKWFCHSCMQKGEGKDNIHIFAAHFGLNPRSDFQEICRRAADEFNLDNPDALNSATKTKIHNAPPPKEKIEGARLVSINDTISDSQKHLAEFIENQGGFYRGLPLSVWQYFHCGFLKDWKHSKKFQRSPRVIVPASTDYQTANYLARLTVPLDSFNQNDRVWINEKEHDGEKTLFNPDALNMPVNAPVVVVEGYIDAMSIWFASDKKIPVVALGAANQALTILNTIDEKHITGRKFIVLFDADIPAQNKTLHSDLQQALIQRGNFAVCKFLFDFLPAELQKELGIKADANQILQVRGKVFLNQLLDKIIDAAQTDFYLEEKKSTVLLTNTDNPVVLTSTILLTNSNSVFDEQIAKWQAVNGVIDPSLLPKIKDAVAFVNDLSPFNFSASLAFDVAARNNVALLKFYLPAFADKFFDILKNARAFSKDALHLIKKESGDNDVSGLSQLKKLATLAPSKILADIDSLAADIKKQHKSFLRDYHAKIAGEKAKARLDEEKKQRESETTATNAKGCPITLRIPYDCYFNDRGISLIDFSGKFPKTITATKNPIVPTKILREPNNHSVQYAVAVKAGNVWRNVIVDGRVLFDPRLILLLADKGAWIEDPKALAKFFARIIAENDSVIPEIKFYSQPGWKGTDFKFFAYPSGSDDYFVRRAGFDYPVLFAERGNPDLWLKKLNEVVEYGGAIVKVFLGNALLAPLIRPLNLQNAQIHIEAPNNSGKSALLKFAASIFGNPLELLKTFAASPKNRIAVAAASNDLPSFFDELETLGGKQAESTLSSMIYEFAEGVANQANKRDGTAREPVKFKGTRLSTAERPILKSHDQRGAYKRLVQIKCNFLLPDFFGSELHFFSENNFGHFGKAWILFIIDRLQDIQQGFFHFISHFPKDGFADWHGNFRDVEPTHLKSVVGSLLAFQFFLISCGIQTDIKSDSLLSDVIEILSLLPTPDEMDDSTRALADLQSFVASHRKFFEFDIKDNSADGFTNVNASAFESYGKIFKNGEVAFYPTALKKILEKELGYASADALISAFAFKGLLRRSQGKGYRFSTRIKGVAVNTIRFKNGVLLSNVNEEMEYEEELSE